MDAASPRETSVMVEMIVETGRMRETVMLTNAWTVESVGALRTAKIFLWDTR